MDRIKMTSLSLSASAIISIAIHEGFRSEAYTPVKGDVATIGFGTTENVKPTDTITVERALVRLLNDTNKFERAVKRCADVPMHSYEYSAYVSLTYNIGEQCIII